MPNQEGSRLTPSVISILPDSDQVTVGQAALSNLETQPQQVIYSVKRFIGRTFRDQWVQHDQTHVTYDIQEVI